MERGPRAAVERDEAQEEALIRAFVIPGRRERYLSQRSSAKRRLKLINRNFDDARDLDSRLMRRVEPSQQEAEVIYALLRAKGASDECYVMGASDFDGQWTGLRAALDQVVGWEPGTFISCVPGKLAYYEGEYKNERYVLERSV